MSRIEAADVFGRRRDESSDADWQIFCRGRSEQEPVKSPWPSHDALDTPGPVELEPGESPDNAEPPTGGGGPAVRHCVVKVAGVAYPNEDGTSRREAVRQLRRWDLVRLRHRPDNPVDPNAVAVFRRADARQLGYLPAPLARQVVAGARERGARYLAVVSDVTGGDSDFIPSGQSVGAKLVVLALEGGATKAMARRYLLDLMNRGATATSTSA